MINLKAYFSKHVFAGMNSLGQLSRAPVASLMTCMVIGITLSLPIALFIFLKNVDQIRDRFQQTAQLTLYLKKNVSKAEALKLTSILQTKDTIESVRAISPEEGLAELQQQAGFQGVLEELQDNPLPWAIVVEPRITHHSTSEFTDLEESLRKMPQIDSIQIDMLWVKRLGSFVALAKRTTIALTALLGIAVLLIINNTIRSATQHNQREIEVIKLIGGTNAFIRRPFLYAGILYGLLGGIIAWLAVDSLLLLINNPIHRLTELYHSNFILAGLDFSDTVNLLAASMSLGLIGSWLAVTRHLKK